jgi:hypothetical protein
LVLHPVTAIARRVSPAASLRCLAYERFMLITCRFGDRILREKRATSKPSKSRPVTKPKHKSTLVRGCQLMPVLVHEYRQTSATAALLSHLRQPFGLPAR